MHGTHLSHAVQVAALERELAELRQARGKRAYGLPSRADIISSLGLDRCREERLLPTASSASSLDIEAANKKDKALPGLRCARAAALFGRKTNNWHRNHCDAMAFMCPLMWP